LNDMRRDRKRTLLHGSANRGTPKAVQWLLKNGADPNALDEYGRTPLLARAARNTSTSVINLMIDAGSELNARDSSGKTPLDLNEPLIPGLPAVGSTAGWSTPSLRRGEFGRIFHDAAVRQGRQFAESLHLRLVGPESPRPLRGGPAAIRRQDPYRPLSLANKDSTNFQHAHRQRRSRRFFC
jgi:hypothetical protein